ncbi:MAG TPA: hypothetical protein VI248_24390 [Kineosporiaceae bacterium]
MPRLSHTARPAGPAAESPRPDRAWPKAAGPAAAALVVSAAAALVPLVGPASVGSPSAVSASAPGPPGAGRAPGAGTRVSGPSALPGAAADAVPASRAVLFIGPAAVLRPRAGAARSFPCRAAASLGWGCSVRTATGAGAVPAGTRADVVVLVMTTQDDVGGLARTLDGLPASVDRARRVILAPIAVTAPKALAPRLPAIRELAAARGVDLIDPVARHWVTAATRRTYLGADGLQPTAAGLDWFAGKLAGALAEVRV